ncbi:2-oxoisovalerate dehydrogenase E1 component alpha subunit [Seinonella peptonophila]|uniref:2-oxoisovalerate dehydrogenase subunit alpha n=1 Tax=Seinonella peptonophila TaxID=112248 RepID=A0A1M4TLC5_9BACL|nr:thiamine pyrophosphate-dependent dehydrogenase E1 component subunit alpha [Seinonella peptonophila]SHE45164.1 2-oxoisovalerate dehydrogenase E1 component alpha subunit [Seinonella peptonophila]
MHISLGLTDEQVLEMYRYMLMTRKLDDRMWLLNRAGSIPFAISCQGHEAIHMGVAYTLNHEKDWVCPYYRDLGLMLALGQTCRDQLLFAFARKEDPNSGGRQMPGHFGDRRFRILSGSSPVGTQVLHAVGIAYGGRLTGSDHVVFTSCGEGSANQGDFHEACNFAGVHRLPVIFMVENNKYAISVPLRKQVAGESIAARANGYGFPGVTVDGTDVFAVYQAMKEAVDRARRGEGPTLIEAVTYRLQPHSSDDDDSSYRSRDEVDLAKKRDPIQLFRNYLVEQGLLSDDYEHRVIARITKEINEATEYAEQAPDPDPSDLYRYIYATDEGR